MNLTRCTNKPTTTLLGANNNDDLFVHTVCDKAGKTLAFTTVTIHQNEKLIASGRHTKFIGNGGGRDKIDFKSKL